MTPSGLPDFVECEILPMEHVANGVPIDRIHVNRRRAIEMEQNHSK